MQVELLLAAEGGSEALANFPQRQTAAIAGRHQSVDLSGGRIGKKQRADGVEEDDADSRGIMAVHSHERQQQGKYPTATEAPRVPKTPPGATFLEGLGM